MPVVRDVSAIREKWERVTPGRADDYERGVRDPKEDWAEAASEAEGAYIQGVTEAAQKKRFGAGVRKAGTAKWARKALEIGVGRFGPGVRAAGPDYEAGFAPYREVISRTTLPPRKAKGDPANIERVAQMAQALHDAKVKGA